MFVFLPLFLALAIRVATSSQPTSGIILYNDTNFQGEAIHVDNPGQLVNRTLSAVVLSGNWILYNLRLPRLKVTQILSPGGEYPSLKSNGTIVIKRLPDSGIVLFEGRDLSKTMHHFTDSSDQHQGYPDDKIESAVVLSDDWVLYEHPGYKGNGEYLTRGVYLTVEPLSSSMRKLSTEGISLFEETGLRGRMHRLTESKDQSQGYPDDKIKSSYVGSGTWALFEHPGFQGDFEVLQRGEHMTLRSNLTSSARDLTTTNMGIILFEGEGLTGKEHQFVASTGLSEGYPSNKVKSAIVASGNWLLYDDDFKGKTQYLTPGVYKTLKSTRSSSIHRLPYEGVAVFEGRNLEGKAYTFSDTADLSDGYPNDRAKSAVVMSDGWIFYQNEKFSGSNYCLKKGFHDKLKDVPRDSLLNGIFGPLHRKKMSSSLKKCTLA